MKRPLIGVTMDSGDKPGRYSLNADYTASIEKAGGLSIPIPFRTDPSLIPQIVDLIHGILFIGGDDMDPALYNQPWHPKAIRMEPERWQFELKLMAEIERRRRPTLGICHGSQLMNVYRGGSLHQFLPEVTRDNAIEHRRLDPNAPPSRHAVRLNPESAVAAAVAKPEISANSFHKQSIDKLGRGLRVIATAPDGVIEGIEDPSMPLFTAVQWHPERLTDEAEHLALFRLLVDKAR